jgi:hypothetical protein
MLTNDSPNLDKDASPKSAGRFSSLFSGSKLVLAILALLTLVDSLLPPRLATPGHGAAFLLSWVLVTRLWLAGPSRILMSVCLIAASACLCANHGLLSSIGLFHSFYSYFFVALTILFWERLTRVLRLSG